MAHGRKKGEAQNPERHRRRGETAVEMTWKFVNRTLRLKLHLSAVALHADALWLLRQSERMLRASQHSASSSHTGQAQRPSLLVPSYDPSRWAVPGKKRFHQRFTFGVISIRRLLSRGRIVHAVQMLAQTAPVRHASLEW